MLQLRLLVAVLVIHGADAHAEPICTIETVFQGKIWHYFSCIAVQDVCRDLQWGDGWRLATETILPSLTQPILTPYDSRLKEEDAPGQEPDYVEDNPCEPSKCFQEFIHTQRPVFHMCPVTCGTCASTSIGGYTIVPGKCVARLESISIDIGKTLPECVHLCEQESKCLSFEYIEPLFMPSEDSKCLLKDSVDYEGSWCTYRNYVSGVYDLSSKNRRWNGDLYIKPANRIGVEADGRGTVAVPVDTPNSDAVVEDHSVSLAPAMDSDKALLLTVFGHGGEIGRQATTGTSRTACWFVLSFIAVALAFRLLYTASVAVICGKFAMPSMRMWRSSAPGKYEYDDTRVRLEVKARIVLLRKKMSLALATIALTYTTFSEFQNHVVHPDVGNSVNLISIIILLGYVLVGMGSGRDHSKIMAAIALGAFASLLEAWAILSVLPAPNIQHTAPFTDYIDKLEELRYIPGVLVGQAVLHDLVVRAACSACIPSNEAAVGNIVYWSLKSLILFNYLPEELVMFGTVRGDGKVLVYRAPEMEMISRYASLAGWDMFERLLQTAWTHSDSAFSETMIATVVILISVCVEKVIAAQIRSKIEQQSTESHLAAACEIVDRYCDATVVLDEKLQFVGCAPRLEAMLCKRTGALTAETSASTFWDCVCEDDKEVLDGLCSKLLHGASTEMGALSLRDAYGCEVRVNVTATCFKVDPGQRTRLLLGLNEASDLNDLDNHGKSADSASAYLTNCYAIIDRESMCIKVANAAFWSCLGVESSSDVHLTDVFADRKIYKLISQDEPVGKCCTKLTVREKEGSVTVRAWIEYQGLLGAHGSSLGMIRVRRIEDPQHRPQNDDAKSTTSQSSMASSMSEASIATTESLLQEMVWIDAFTTRYQLLDASEKFLRLGDSGPATELCSMLLPEDLKRLTEWLANEDMQERMELALRPHGVDEIHKPMFYAVIDKRVKLGLVAPRMRAGVPAAVCQEFQRAGTDPIPLWFTIIRWGDSGTMIKDKYTEMLVDLDSGQVLQARWCDKGLKRLWMKLGGNHNFAAAFMEQCHLDSKIQEVSNSVLSGNRTMPCGIGAYSLAANQKCRIYLTVKLTLQECTFASGRTTALICLEPQGLKTFEQSHFQGPKLSADVIGGRCSL